MKVCVVGAGAIGGFIGTRLAVGGHDVSAFARGATLNALRKHGWRLRQGGKLRGAPARASDASADLGAQDLVVIAVKGQSLPGVWVNLVTGKRRRCGGIKLGSVLPSNIQPPVIRSKGARATWRSPTLKPLGPPTQNTGCGAGKAGGRDQRPSW
jgi:prephenate dehydrogenase